MYEKFKVHSFQQFLGAFKSNIFHCTVHTRAIHFQSGAISYKSLSTVKIKSPWNFGIIIPTFDKCCFTIERSIQKYRENGKHPDRMTPSDLTVQKLNGPLYVKSNNMACAPSENSDQPGHPPSLIRVFAVRSKDSQGPMASSSGQRRLWSDWANAQARASTNFQILEVLNFLPLKFGGSTENFRKFQFATRFYRNSSICILFCLCLFLDIFNRTFMSLLWLWLSWVSSLFCFNNFHRRVGCFVSVLLVFFLPFFFFIILFYFFFFSFKLSRLH